MSPSVENIAGYAVGTQNISACVADVVAWIEQAQPDAPCRWLACLNPHSYAVALDDPPFAQAIHAANWLIPDGSGIVLASKLLGGQIRQRVTGSDIFREVQVELNRSGGYRVFFLGSTEATLAAIRQRLGLEWLPRLLQQPRRLWRRMGVSAPIFLWHVLRARALRGTADSDP